MNFDEYDNEELPDSRMFDEYSLADSQTLGTGYIVDVRDGSVSMITDDMVDAESKTTVSDSNALQVEISGWNVFSNLFSTNPSDPSEKNLPRKQSSQRSNSNTNDPDQFEDNVNNLYGNADFYFNNNYNGSSRRRKNKVMFRQLSNDTNQKSNNNNNHHHRDSQQEEQIDASPSPMKRGDHDNNVHYNGDDDNNDERPLGANDIIVDFLKDKPSDMTWGRRIALKLMKYSWYYPKAKEVAQREAIDRILLDTTKLFSGEEILRAISDGENKDDEEENENDKHDIEQVEIFHDDPTASNFVVPPSLERAWAYFEHITLPRYVHEERKDESMIQSCVNPKGVEIAESGERYFKTRLYNPFFTPLSQLGEFGLGVAMYFTTLRAIMILLFLVGLINVPNFLYFSGAEYSNGQLNVPWSLKGSAICTDLEFVPCTDCNEENFALAKDRLRSVTSTDGTPMTFALKNNCVGVTKTTLITSFVSVLVITVGLAVLAFFLSSREKEFDEDVQSAKDYSIVIANPPSDAGDVEEWREYFTNTFEDVHVSCCTIAVHNKSLLKALVKRREVLHKLRKLLPPGASLQKENLEVLIQDMKDKRCCCSFYTAPSLYESLLNLEERIKLLLVDNKPVVSVFVTFETESSQRQVLRKLKAEQGDDFNKKYAFRESHEALKVKEAAEPSAVRWQDLSESTPTILSSYIIPYIVTFALILGSATLTRYVRRGFWILPASPSNAALVINIGNVLFPYIANVLTNLEVHRREGNKETSLYIKYTLFRWVNTAVVTTLITPSTSTLMSGERDTFVVIFNVFLYQIIFTGLGCFDFIQNFKRHILAPRAKTQEDMNTLMGGMELDIAERYSSLTTTLFLTVWYSSLYPAVLFFGGISLCCTFIAEKFQLMRTWAPAAKLGGIISRINRQFFFPTTSLVMILTATYAWYGFNYDNLCAVDQIMNSDDLASFNGTFTIPSFVNSEIEAVLNFNQETMVYKYCDQSSWQYAIPVMPSINGFSGIGWMTNEAKNAMNMFSATAIALIVIIIVSMSYGVGYSFGRRLKPILSKITFTASAANAYIPQVKSEIISFPLIGSSVYEVANPHLFEWSSPYHPHSYYDLTLDALDVMKDSDQDIAELAFSKVRYWEAPVM